MLKQTLIGVCLVAPWSFPEESPAQWSSDPPTYLALAEPGEPAPEFNVGELHLQIDGWDIVPIYSLVENADAGPDQSPWTVRVRGFFVATDPVATTGENLIAVWYERPDDPTQEAWTAHTWDQGDISIAEAASSVKLSLGIPDIQDQLWAIDDLEFVNPKVPVPFASGFVAGDPLAAPVNASPNRDEDIALLKDAGYPLADVPFESGNQDEVQVFLEYLAEIFQPVIQHGDWEVLPPADCILPNDWLLPVHDFDELDFDLFPAAVCTPQIIAEGDWEPLDPSLLCDCRNTAGVAFACGTYEFDVTGKIDFRVPFPLPHGTRIELEGHAGLELTFCICFRTRFCTGPAQRQIKWRNADCTISTQTEVKENLRFSKSWWTITADAQTCADSNWIPIEMPYDDVDCGLTINDVP